MSMEKNWKKRHRNKVLADLATAVIDYEVSLPNTKLIDRLSRH